MSVVISLDNYVSLFELAVSTSQLLNHKYIVIITYFNLYVSLENVFADVYIQTVSLKLYTTIFISIFVIL